jgi:hypothetical protein
MVKKKTDATITERDVLTAIAQAVDDIREPLITDEEVQRFILSSIPDDEFFNAVATNYPGALTLAFFEVQMTELAKRAGNPVLAGVIDRRFRRLRENRQLRGHRLAEVHRGSLPRRCGPQTSTAQPER